MHVADRGHDPERSRTRTPVTRRPLTRGLRGSPGLFSLQRALGNRGVNHLLAGRGLQAKLTVNQPGDPYEQEADRVADQVMRMPAPALGLSGIPPTEGFQLQRCGCGGSARGGVPCPACSAEEEDQLHRAGTGEGGVAPPIVHHVLRSPGELLDPVTLGFMEPRLGVDLTGVRIHRDTAAAESARAVSALAYTVGSNVVFGAGQYQPGTSGGRRLLVHELAHVLQQARPGAFPALRRQLYPPVPIVVTPLSRSEPVEINAVDARQETGTAWYAPWRYTGPLTSFFRGDVTMTDISSMVTNVLAALRGRSMHRLNIMDHGNERGVEIGDDWLTSGADVAAKGRALGRLRPKFAGNGIVHMQNCKAGANSGLICALASAFGVPVYAGTGLHNPLLGFNTGDYVRCDSSGTFNPDAGRPSTPAPPDRGSQIA